MKEGRSLANCSRGAGRGCSVGLPVRTCLDFTALAVVGCVQCWLLSCASLVCGGCSG